MYFIQHTHKAAIKKILPQKTPILSGFSPFLGHISEIWEHWVGVIFNAEYIDIKETQIFEHANRVQKILCEQGFEAHRMNKAEIKRLLALYFDAALYGEQMPDVDGVNNFCLE